MLNSSDMAVFVVDDEVDNLDFYKRALAHYQLRAFANPLEALRAIVEENPTCLVVDYRMPELSGIDLVKECRKAGYDGAVLMITAFSEFDELVYAEQVSLLYRIIPKPVPVAHLKEQVELVVAESRFRKNLEGRRKFPRVCMPLALRAELNGVWQPVEAKNVSVGGILVGADLRFYDQQLLRLKLEDGGEALMALGRIVHIGEAGVGVEFVDPSATFRQVIGELILHHRYELGARRAGPDSVVTRTGAPPITA